MLLLPVLGCLCYLLRQKSIHEMFIIVFEGCHLLCYFFYPAIYFLLSVYCFLLSAGLAIFVEMKLKSDLWTFWTFFVAIHIPLSLVPWSFLSEMVNFWVQSHCIHLHCFRACFHGDTGFSWLSDEAFVWLSDWSEVQIVLYGPADATASQTSSSLASFKSRLVLPFCLPRLSWKRGR